MKRCNLIKRFFIGLLLIVVASISANAQEGLYVKSIFQRFGHAKGCKMVTMKNTQLKGYRLKIYKSLVYKNHGNSPLSEVRPQGCKENQRGGGEWQDGERLLHDGTFKQWRQPLHPLQQPE